MRAENSLDALLVPVVEAAGYRLVRLRVMGAKRKTVQVMAERPDGSMNVDDCASLSRALSEVLEAADPLPEEFVLEVSSPGIDRPLTARDDFARFAGHDARVEMTEALNGRKRFKGALAGVDGADVLMDVTGENGPERMRLPFANIAEAKLVLTDRLIEESLKARASREAETSH